MIVKKFPKRVTSSGRHIAPRLADGEKRIGFGHGLPPDVKERVREIAERRRCSMSWLMEQTIISVFRMRTPDYLIPKQPKKKENVG